MSDKIDDGGQFHSYTILTKEQLHTGAQGITRRDWLAGLAMQAMLSDMGDEKNNQKTAEFKAIPILAYRMADLMIAESKKENLHENF